MPTITGKASGYPGISVRVAARRRRTLTRIHSQASFPCIVDHARLALHTWLITGALPESEPPSPALLAAAEEQGLTGLLADSALVRDTWPADARVPLHQAARRALLRTLRQLDLAARLHVQLLRHGLRSLPLKGAAVAEWLYDSPGHRPMSDVDLLALDTPADALLVLEHAGFERVATSEHADALRDPATGAIVELHRSVTSCPALFPLDVEGLWQRRLGRTGQVPCVPCASDLLVLLALHATFQHGLVLTLSQWLDFKRLAELAPPERSALEALTERRPAARAVALALLAARAVVAASFPPDLVEWADHVLSPPLRMRVRSARDAPLSLLTPASVPLARVRWGIAAGRRVELLRATLFPDAPGPTRRWLRLPTETLKRGLRLARQLHRH